MGKQIRRQTCGKYWFRLVGSPKLYYKEQVMINFGSKKYSNARKIKSIIPIFNKDRKYYTSAFIIKANTKTNTSDEQLIQQHQKRVYDAQMPIIDLYIPKPRSKNKYCGVCRDYYEQYLQHIESESHLISLHKSDSQLLIAQLCSQFQRTSHNSEENKTVLQSTSEQPFMTRSASNITHLQQPQLPSMNNINN